MHESLRLEPASPVAWRQATVDVEVAGRAVAAGTRVVLDLKAANQDPEVWGPTGATFDPHRVLPDGVSPWGLSFGAGPHACIGQELDGGLVEGAGGTSTHLFGTVAVMAHAVLAAGGRPDPASPPVLDPASVRTHYSSYPILFGAPTSSGDRE